MKQNSHFLKRTSNFEVFKFLAASLIWKENRSKWLQYLIEVLSNLQLITIIMNSPYLFNLFYSQNTTSSGLRDIVQSVSLIGKLPLAQSYFITSIFIFICSYFILLLCLLIHVCVRYFQKQNLSSFSHSLLTYWVQLHHTLIFWIFNLFLMSICSNNPTTKVIAFGMSDKSIPIKMLGIFLIIVNNVFAFLATLFCYDPFMTNNPFASYNSKSQRLTFLHKAIISPILVFVIDPKIAKWLVIGVNFISALIRQETLYQDFPYYKYTTMRVTSLLASSAFCLAFIHLITGILDEFDQPTSSDIIFLEIAISILFVKLSDSRLDYIIQKYISTPETHLFQKDIFKRIFVLTELKRQTKFMLGSDLNRVCNQHTIYLMGKLSAHNDCNGRSCICQYMLSKNNKDTRLESFLEVHKVSDQLQAQIILDILSKAIKGFRNNGIFKIMYAYVLLSCHRNLTQTFFTIFSIGSKFLTFNEEIIIFYLKKKLEEEISFSSKTSPDDIQNNDKDNSLDIKKTVDIEKQSEVLSRLIETTSESYIDLWSYYLRSTFDLQQFMVKSKSIENNAQDIQDLWNKISRDHDYMSPYVHALYCTYLTLVRNSPSQAEKIFLRHHSRKQKNQNQVDDILSDLDLNDSCDVIFYISMAKDTLGRVLHTSRNIFEELGWKQLEVIDRNIKTIQPSFIKDRHDQILLNHIEGRNKEPIRSNFEGFMYNKRGYSVPVQGQVTIFPYIEKQPIYAGIVRKNEVAYEYLVLASNGIVEAYSEKIFKYLDIAPNQTVHISQICKNFEEIKPKLDSSFKLKDTNSLSINKTKNKEVIMSFCPAESRSNLLRKEITYSVKIDLFVILDQSFLYLNLYNKRKDPNLIEKSYNNLDKFEIDSENNEHGLLDLVPEEFAKSQQKEEDSAKNENPLFTLSAFVRRSIYSKINSQSITKNPTEFAETQTPINTIKPKGITRFNSSLSDFSGPDENLVESRKSHKIPYYNKVEVGMDTVSRSSSVKGQIDAQNKLEEAVYVVPSEKYTRILDYLIMMFAVVCVGLICSHLINSHYKFGQNLEKIELIVMSQRRSLALSNVDYYVRSLDFITKGVLSDLRHITTGTFSLKLYMQASVFSHVTLLHQYNNNLFNSLYILDQSAQAEIYKNQVKVIRPDSIQTDQEIDAFRVLTDIANSGLKVGQMDPSTVSTAIPEVKFVLDNALNGPLIASEQIINIIIDDCKQDLYEIRQTDFLLLTVTVSFGVFILLLLFLDIKKFLAKRDLLIEILFRINDKMILNHLKIVSKFHERLSSSMFNPSTYVEMTSRLPKIVDAKSTKRKNQNVSMKGINSKIIQGLLFTGATVIVFASVFIIIAFNFQSSMDDFLWKIDRMVQACSFRINLNLLHLGVLEYIGENNSTLIRGRPIEEEINYQFAQARLIPDMMNQITLNTKGIDGTFLKTLFEGNLCTLIKVPGYPDFFCDYIGDIIGAKGLVRMATFLVKGYEEAKTVYDGSNRTLMDAFMAAGSESKVIGEEIGPFAIKACEIVEDLFKEDLRQSVLSYEEDTILIMVCYILVCVFLAFILSFRVWKNMKKERGSWRKIIRQIPFSIVVSNKLLKTFLVNNCDHMLDSFKNLI